VKRAWTWLDDRLNPILVKEVRQALRSRYFIGTYSLALIMATGIGMFVLMGADGDELGMIFFATVYVCLAAATMGLVPFQAFLAAGGGWDAEKTNVLLLTDLRPAQIVRGRLLSSLTQSLLILLALLPFLGLAFLLPGVDLAAAGVVLVTTLIFSGYLSCLTIAASWLTSNKLLRVLLMTFLGGGLLWFTGIAVALGIEMLDHPDNMADDEFWWAWAAIVLHGGAVAAFAFAAACARIAHPEENRSRPLRLLTLGITASLLVAIYVLMDKVSHPDDEMVVALAAYGSLALSVPFAFFLTEPERLGRRVRIELPRRSLLALLSAPLQPGGGNGFLLLLATCAAFFGVLIVAPPPNVDNWADEYVPGLLTCGAYLILAVGLTTPVFARWTDRTTVRVLAVLSVPAFCAASMVAPAFWGFLVDDRDLERFRHVGNPVYTMEQAFRGDFSFEPLLFLGVIVVLAVNVPRVVRGLRLVREARASTPS
jgi:hypothetical protein